MQTIEEQTSVKQTYETLARKIGHIVPDAELRLKAELAYEINRIKKEKDAIILGHNYMEPALYHSIPDYVGDSLGLSRIAAGTRAKRIVFCGVRFMAETAKILNPDRMVLLPAEHAGCSLAASITAAEVRDLKKRYPGAPVVTYINTYAEVKAETDICCTSSNASKVVDSLDSDLVICIPDEFLARNVARETSREVIYSDEPAPDGVKAVVVWRGRCEVHEQFTVADVQRVRAQFDDVCVLAHPECEPGVVEAADFSGSTTAMVKYVRESNAGRFLLLTECSMSDNVSAENPDKEFLGLCSIRCPHMNQITLEDTLTCLREDRYQIEIDEDIRIKARQSLDRMLAYS